jgi:hypothetical protein
MFNIQDPAAAESEEIDELPSQEELQVAQDCRISEMFNRYKCYLLEGDAFMKELCNFLMMNDYFAMTMSRRLFFTSFSYDDITTFVKIERKKWQDRKLPGYDETKCAWRCKNSDVINSFLI